MLNRGLFLILLAVSLLNSCQEIPRFVRGPSVILVLTENMDSELNMIPIPTSFSGKGAFVDYYPIGLGSSDSRASVMSGHYPGRYEIPPEIGLEEGNRLGLKRNVFTIADHFRLKGYKTGYFGKWHLGQSLLMHPKKNGFDQFVGFLGAAIDPVSHRDSLGRIDWWHNRSTKDERGNPQTLSLSYAFDFADRNAKVPYFLCISLKGNNGDQTENEILEKIWQTLGDRGEQAVLVSIPIPGKEYNQAASKEPLPLRAFIYAPGLDPVQARDQELAAIDIFPTLVGLLGHSVRKTFDGQDLSIQLSDEKVEDGRKLFWEKEGFRIVKQDKWKLVIDPSQNIYLYDLEEDPMAETNLSVKETEKALELIEAHQQWRKNFLK